MDYLKSAAETEGLIGFLQTLLPHRGGQVKSKKESLERFLTKQLENTLENQEFGSELRASITELITPPKNTKENTPDKEENAALNEEDQEETSFIVNGADLGDIFSAGNYAENLNPQNRRLRIVGTKRVRREMRKRKILERRRVVMQLIQ